MMIDKSTLVRVCFVVLEILSLMGVAFFGGTGSVAKLHLGNYIGAALSAAVFIICIKRKTVAAFLHTKAGTAVLILVLICLIAAAVLSGLMVMQMNRLPEKPCAVIVLGCRVKADGPSSMLRSRIAAAYEYMKENEDVICVASGGQGSDEPMTEAKCIKDELTAMGISAERIFIEDESESTAENIEFSMKILDELGLERKAVIVTSEFHQLRAHIMAERRGLDAYSISAPTLPVLIPSYWIREWFGIAYEFVFGK